MVSAQQLRLIYVAHHYGSAGVFKALRRATKSPLADAHSTMKETQQVAASEMLAGALQGHFSIETNGAIELLQTLTKMESKDAANDGIDDDAKMGLTKLSMAQGAQLVLRKLLMAIATDQLEAAQEYDEAAIREQLNKKASDAGGAASGPNGKPTS